MPRFAKGSPEAIAWGQKMKASRMAKKGKGIGSSLGRLAGTALGSVGGPMGSAVGSQIGSALGNMAEKKLEKAITGKGAQLSKPMKKAMRDNYNVEMPTMSLKASSSGKVDGRVKPSGDMMTLSPYQKTNSPAMNPFVPTTYFQEGGQGSGYGEAIPPVIKGSGMRRRRNKGLVMKGSGMKGCGLYGAGLM
jgi:hypothetical protein